MFTTTALFIVYTTQISQYESSVVCTAHVSHVHQHGHLGSRSTSLQPAPKAPARSRLQADYCTDPGPAANKRRGPQKSSDAHMLHRMHPAPTGPCPDPAASRPAAQRWAVSVPSAKPSTRGQLARVTVGSPPLVALGVGGGRGLVGRAGCCHHFWRGDASIDARSLDDLPRQGLA